jgi:hypothetical protein
MLTSFASATSSSSSSAYESPPAWWKFNFTGTSCAALATALLPSSISIESSSSNNSVEKRTNPIDHHCQCKYKYTYIYLIRKFYSIERKKAE